MGPFPPTRDNDGRAGRQQEQNPDRVTLGTVLFIITTAVAYFKLTWGFMDKSLFFLLGGILLLSLSWYLRRRANHTFADKSTAKS